MDDLIQALHEFPCPYALTANVHCCLQTVFQSNDLVSWREYLWRVSSVIADLPEAVDIVAIEVPVCPTASPSTFLAGSIHSTLAGLVHYCHGDAALLYKEILTTGWEYTILGKDYFPLLLSPVYPSDHPRHLDWRQPVLLLQPEASFTRYGVSSEMQHRAKVSLLAEHAFQKAGRRYYGQITRNLPKAFRVIKPLRESDAPVRWWETELFVDFNGFQHTL